MLIVSLFSRDSSLILNSFPSRKRSNNVRVSSFDCVPTNSPIFACTRSQWPHGSGEAVVAFRKSSGISRQSLVAIYHFSNFLQQFTRCFLFRQSPQRTLFSSNFSISLAMIAIDERLYESNFPPIMVRKAGWLVVPCAIHIPYYTS